MNDYLKSEGQRRLLWWIIGGGGAVVIGWILLGILFIAVAAIFLGGFGFWIHGLFTGVAPPMGTPTARAIEWLPAVEAAEPALPAALGLAVIAQASGGQVYGDRYYCVNGTSEQSSGLTCRSAFGTAWTDLGEAYGLTGVNAKDVSAPSTASGDSVHTVAWNLAAGLHRLSAVLATDPLLQTALPTFHRTTQAPPHWIFSDYADTIRADIATYGGPQMAAWAITNWNKITGAYEDPGGAKDWVLVVAAAPTGPSWQLEWKAPTIKTITKTRQVTVWVWRTEWVTYWTDHGKDRHTKKERVRVKTRQTEQYTVQKIIDHNLTGRALEQPITVYARMANGTLRYLSDSAQNGNVPVWPGGVAWGADLDLQQVSRIYAVWPGGLTESIPWPPQSGVATGAVAHMPPIQAVRQWWPDIESASAQTGAPPGLIAAIMLHESGGDADAVNLQGPAYGLMQILPTTAAGLPGYAPGWQTNGALNILLGAELLQANYQQTQSWHATIAAYYGGLGTMEDDGYVPGMPWSEASSLLNVVPAAYAGNTQTMTSYADQMLEESQSIARTEQSKARRGKNLKVSITKGA